MSLTPFPMSLAPFPVAPVALFSSHRTSVTEPRQMDWEMRTMSSNGRLDTMEFEVRIGLCVVLLAALALVAGCTDQRKISQTEEAVLSECTLLGVDAETISGISRSFALEPLNTQALSDLQRTLRVQSAQGSSGATGGLSGITTFRQLKGWWIDRARDEAMGYFEVDTVMSLPGALEPKAIRARSCFLAGRPQNPYHLFEIWKKYLRGQFQIGAAETPAVSTRILVLSHPPTTNGKGSGITFSARYDGPLQDFPQIGGRMAFLSIRPVDPQQYTGGDDTKGVQENSIQTDDFRKLLNSSSNTIVEVSELIQES